MVKTLRYPRRSSGWLSRTMLAAANLCTFTLVSTKRIFLLRNNILDATSPHIHRGSRNGGFAHVLGQRFRPSSARRPRSLTPTFQSSASGRLPLSDEIGLVQDPEILPEARFKGCADPSCAKFEKYIRRNPGRCHSAQFDLCEQQTFT